ncbi:hypothetical protein TSOC_010567 [Tetrabaena socialis]|uniref:phytol kinase n=1 Tax=Tetrabaena socialis TaxID=47790 RepID=A0A2J7ZSY0_9CHLO|nr:hypothetical protein TSOC_010567 [Tetrabaena socialis]|eukprot:PNH03350.1 hypothetical protein TSOC_010567 [Tetrabaena socialis]
MTAAALAAGMLPCLERLLRRGGQAPGEAGEVPNLQLCLLLKAEVFDLESLAPLLAYGEPRQAAALVATVRKLLACRAAPASLRQLCAGDAVRGPGSHPEAVLLALRILEVAQQWMLAGARYAVVWQVPIAPPEMRAAAVAAVAVGPGRQLALVVSRAASDWLPLLSRLFEALAPLLLGTVPADSGLMHNAVTCLKPLLVWLPLLARCGGVEQGTADVPATTSGWRRWLLEEMRVVPLLGTALGLLPLLLLHEQRAQETDCVGCEIALLLGESCCCVAAAFPDEVRSAALSAAAAEEGVASGGSGASRGGGLGGRSSGWRAGGLSGARAGGSLSSSSNNSGSQSQPADWAGAAAASRPGGWRPSLLRALAAELRAHGRDAAHAAVAAAVADLAGKLEACRAGRSGLGGGEAGAGWLGTPALVNAWDEGASGLRVPPPAEGRALLRTCANPACDNLAGGSEAELPLRACGRCGAAWYRRRECQTAHWRAGHREACGRHGAGGRGADGLAAMGVS